MKPCALTKSSQLRKQWEYNQVYRNGRRRQGNNFSLICLPNSRCENRLGISIHGRLKGAVKRNRIKRIIKEFFRLNRSLLPDSMDLVFTIRRGFALRNPAAVKQAVIDLLTDKPLHFPAPDSQPENRRHPPGE